MIPAAHGERSDPQSNDRVDPAATPGHADALHGSGQIQPEYASDAVEQIQIETSNDGVSSEAALIPPHGAGTAHATHADQVQASSDARSSHASQHVELTESQSGVSVNAEFVSNSTQADPADRSSNKPDGSSATEPDTHNMHAEATGGNDAATPASASPFAATWSGFKQRLSDVAALISSALDNYWQNLNRWYFKVLFLIAFILALITSVLNYILVPLVNLEGLPQWQSRISEVTLRQVCKRTPDSKRGDSQPHAVRNT